MSHLKESCSLKGFRFFTRTCSSWLLRETRVDRPLPSVLKLGLIVIYYPVNRLWAKNGRDQSFWIGNWYLWTILDLNSFIQWSTSFLLQMDSQELSLQFIIDLTKRIGSDLATNTESQLRDMNHVETIEQKSAHFLLIGRISRRWKHIHTF